jgi:glycerol-3-phosphate dehydrogenase
MNLLLDRPAKDIALAAAAPSGRMYTLVPWRGLTLVGTWQAETTDDASEAVPESFLRDVNAAFPSLKATRADVRFVHDARVPAATTGGRVDLLADPIVTRAAGHPGVVVLAGVKYTTARLAAERAVDLATDRRGGRTVVSPLPHADVTDSEGLIEEVLRTRRLQVDRDVLRHLASWYGSEGAAVVTAAADAGLLDRLADGSPVIAGEVTWAARHSAVVHLSDIVFRRTMFASAGLPAGSDAGLVRAAALAGDVLGWSAERQRAEVAKVTGRLATQ